MIMITKALLADYPQPSAAQIKEYLHGNICRCTGYKKIIEAIQRAAAGMTDATESSRGTR